MLCDASGCVVRAGCAVWLCLEHVHYVCVCVHKNMPTDRMHVVEDRAGARPKFARYEAEIGTDDGCMFPTGAKVDAKKKSRRGAGGCKRVGRNGIPSHGS